MSISQTEPRAMCCADQITGIEQEAPRRPVQTPAGMRTDIQEGRYRRAAAHQDHADRPVRRRDLDRSRAAITQIFESA